MKTIEVKTPGGYAVTLNSYLTYGQFLELQELQTAGIRMSLEDGKPSVKDIDTKALIQGNRKVMDFLLVKVIDPEGKEVSSPVDAVLGMPFIDGKFVADKIDAITAPAYTTLKKGGQ